MKKLTFALLATITSLNVYAENIPRLNTQVDMDIVECQNYAMTYENLIYIRSEWKQSSSHNLRMNWYKRYQDTFKLTEERMNNCYTVQQLLEGRQYKVTHEYKNMYGNYIY